MLRSSTNVHIPNFPKILHSSQRHSLKNWPSPTPNSNCSAHLYHVGNYCPHPRNSTVKFTKSCNIWSISLHLSHFLTNWNHSNFKIVTSFGNCWGVGLSKFHAKISRRSHALSPSTISNFNNSINSTGFACNFKILQLRNRIELDIQLCETRDLQVLYLCFCFGGTVTHILRLYFVRSVLQLCPTDSRSPQTPWVFFWVKFRPVVAQNDILKRVRARSQSNKVNWTTDL